MCIICCIRNVTRVANHSTAKTATDQGLDESQCLSSDFTQQLNRGGLSIPKLSTIYMYFVNSAVHIISKVSPPKADCRKYMQIYCHMLMHCYPTTSWPAGQLQKFYPLFTFFIIVTESTHLVVRRREKLQ